MNSTLTLEDGRNLGYREFGAPGGFPVLNNHGGLVSGIDISPAHEIALQLGVRIISPDRPGIGESTPKTGRTLFDWANDVRALADHLQLHTFGVIGWSMGGQYALACAHQLAERVTATCLIAGCLPLDDPKNFAELNHMDQRLTEMARTHPQNAGLAFKAMGEIARHTPALWNAMSARGLARSDVETIHRLPAPGLAGMAAPALESAAGMVEEYQSWARPWGFTPEQLKLPVVIWQGGQDHLVPPAWGEEFASRIPKARLHMLPDEGHMLAYNHYRELLSEFI